MVGYLLGCMGLGTDEGIKKEKEKRALEARERGEVATTENEGTGEVVEGVQGMKLVDEVVALSTRDGAESTAVVDRLKEEMDR